MKADAPLATDRFGPVVPTNDDDRGIRKLSYTIGEAVTALGIGRTTLYKLIGEGRIRIVKIGARTLIPAGELHALLDSSAEALL